MSAESRSTGSASSAQDSLSILMASKEDGASLDTSDTSSTARDLEEVTTRLVEHISGRRWDHADFEKYMVPEYSAYQEYQDEPIARSREQYIANYKAFATGNPNYAMDVLHASAHVNEKNGTATVWLHLRVKGHPTNVWRESVTVVDCKKRDGRWLLLRQDGVRGVGWFA